MYNCLKCPGYCCSYHIIPLKKRDVQRLADYFGLSFKKAKEKFTRPQADEEYSMRRKNDHIFGRICQFFDTDKRRCTIYEARPSTCRTYPGGRCGYYDFLASERGRQEDRDMVATTWNR